MVAPVGAAVGSVAGAPVGAAVASVVGAAVGVGKGAAAGAAHGSCSAVVTCRWGYSSRYLYLSKKVLPLCRGHEAGRPRAVVIEALDKVYKCAMAYYTAIEHRARALPM